MIAYRRITLVMLALFTYLFYVAIETGSALGIILSLGGLVVWVEELYRTRPRS